MNIKWRGSMNYHAMMKEYKHVNISSKIENASSHDFIKLVFEELISNLKSLSLRIEDKEKISSDKSRNFSQALSAIIILTESLDFDNGEPIASNLYNLYDFCRRSIIKDYRNNKNEDINVCVEILEDIHNAWSKIG